MTRKNANGEPTGYRWITPDTQGGRFIGRYAGEWVGVEGGDLPCPIWLRFGIPAKGRFCVTGLQVGAGRQDGEEDYEITARMLRDIRLGNILRVVRDGFEGFSGTVLDQTEPGNAMGFTFGEIIGSTAIPLREKQRLRVRRGRKGVDANTLRRSAEAYLDAIRAGESQPLATAATRLDYHPSTIWRHLQKAWELFPDLKPQEANEGNTARQGKSKAKGGN